MYVTFITDGVATVRQHCMCPSHVQLTGTVDLWDYLLLRMEGELLRGMQRLQGRGEWSGGSCGVVSWHDNMEEPDDFNKVP